MWCPACRTEYRQGFEVCADCGAVLVSALPASADRQEPNRKVVGPVLAEDDLVRVATANAVEAELLAAQLRDAGIPAVVFGVGTAGQLAAIQHSEGSRVMVRRADADEAERLVGDLSDSAHGSAPIDDDVLASLAEDAKGWSDPSTGAVV